MDLDLIKKQYHVDLSGLQSTCAMNYARLIRLLPSMREATGFSQRIGISQGKYVTDSLHITIIENCPYTSMLEITQHTVLARKEILRFYVNVYHDCQMAEVMRVQSLQNRVSKRLYPVPILNAVDEKTQLNEFIKEWLEHISLYGYMLDQLSCN